MDTAQPSHSLYIIILNSSIIIHLWPAPNILVGFMIVCSWKWPILLSFLWSPQCDTLLWQTWTLKPWPTSHWAMIMINIKQSSSNLDFLNRLYMIYIGFPMDFPMDFPWKKHQNTRLPQCRHGLPSRTLPLALGQLLPQLLELLLCRLTNRNGQQKNN